MARNGDPENQEEEDRREKREEERESIWTIPAKYKGWYFGLFSLQVAIASAWLVKTAIVDDSVKGISETLLFIWQSLAPVAISSAALALVIIDAWKTTMVFGTWLEETLEKRRQRQIQAAVKKAVETAVEKTRDEEREAVRQFRQRLRDWNRRREAAVAAGENFEEPPPDIDEIENESTQRDE